MLRRATLQVLATATVIPKIENAIHFPESVKMAESNKDFVIGFICTQKLSDDSSLVHMTPGEEVVYSNNHIYSLTHSNNNDRLQEKVRVHEH